MSLESFLLFVGALFGHWQMTMTGIVSLLIALMEKDSGRVFKRTVFFGIAGPALPWGAYLAWLDQYNLVRAQRPEFMVIAQAFLENPYRFEVSTANKGERAATEVRGKILFSGDATNPMGVIKKFSNANDVPSGGPFRIDYGDMAFHPGDYDPALLLVVLDYKDATKNDAKFRNVWCVKWAGIKNGAAKTALGNCSIEERDELVKRIPKDRVAEFLPLGAA